MIGEGRTQQHYGARGSPEIGHLALGGRRAAVHHAAGEIGPDPDGPPKMVHHVGLKDFRQS